MQGMSVFERCIQAAKDYGEDLFPADCMEILKDHYGNRLDYMKPETIHSKLKNLMDVIDHDTDEREFQDIVLSYIETHERKEMLSFQNTDIHSVADDAQMIKRVLAREDIIVEIRGIKLEPVNFSV